MNRKQERTAELLDAYANPRKAAEDRAKRLGVALAPTAAPVAAPPAGKAPMPGWMVRAMPEAADMLAELKHSLDAETWQGMAERLRKGGGHVIDLTTMVAIGNPPSDQWERGRIEHRDGFAVMRVHRREARS